MPRTRKHTIKKTPQTTKQQTKPNNKNKKKICRTGLQKKNSKNSTKQSKTTSKYQHTQPQSKTKPESIPKKQIEVVFTSKYEKETEYTGGERFRNELTALANRYRNLVDNSEEIDSLEYDLHIEGTGENGEIHKTCVEYDVIDDFAGKDVSEMDLQEWMQRTDLGEYEESC